MTDWEGLSRASTKILGFDQRYDGEVNFRVDLSGYAPEEWVAFFNDPQVMSGVSPSAMTVNSGRMGRAVIEARCAEDYIEKCIENIDSRIKEANRKYGEEVVPVEKEAAAREHAARDAEEARLNELQERVDRL